MGSETSGQVSKYPARYKVSRTQTNCRALLMKTQLPSRTFTRESASQTEPPEAGAALPARRCARPAPGAPAHLPQVLLPAGRHTRLEQEARRRCKAKYTAAESTAAGRGWWPGPLRAQRPTARGVSRVRRDSKRPLDTAPKGPRPGSFQRGALCADRPTRTNARPTTRRRRRRGGPASRPPTPGRPAGRRPPPRRSPSRRGAGRGPPRLRTRPPRCPCVSGSTPHHVTAASTQDGGRGQARSAPCLSLRPSVRPVGVQARGPDH